MERGYKIFVLFLFVVFLAVPLSAEEGTDQASVSEDDTMLSLELGEGVVVGKVTSLESDSITVKVEGDKETTFSVVDGETILWKGIEDITLSDIEEGEQAEIGYYTDEADNFIASWVDVIVEEIVSVPMIETEETSGE